MKQFKAILKFELSNFFTDKTYKGLMILISLAILIGLSVPRIKERFFDNNPVKVTTINIIANDEQFEAYKQELTNYQLNRLEMSKQEARESVKNGDYKQIVYVGTDAVDYIVNNLSMQDTLSHEIEMATKNIYTKEKLKALGIDDNTSNEIIDPQVSINVDVIEKIQASSFLYTYAYVFMIYMMVIMFGMIVATNVAQEKSSRTMELLITSADTSTFITAKVLSATIAASVVLFIILASSIVGYQFNKVYYINNPVVQSIFAIPIDLALYAILYFVLGFTMYASMYAALGSTVSKVEDVNKVTSPFTMIFVVGYLIVMQGITTGDIDGIFMKFVSIFPLTSPIAMFARISMGNVQTIELLSSIILLLVCSMLMLKLDAKIYRMGVLMYGTPPKLKNIIKALRQK